MKRWKNAPKLCPACQVAPWEQDEAQDQELERIADELADRALDREAVTA